ncbi:MAG TPA: MMPL family transporter [Solirubrobacterales bacterium]|nr:MMPL family transporter [Solirubrobacterales bacterium]
MSAVVDFAIRRPRLVVGVWIALVAGLGLAGLRIEEQLHLTNPVVPGSDSARTQQVVAEQFGDESALVAGLGGPPAQLRASGPRIARALDRIPHVSVVSPWVSGTSPALRPDASKAVLLLGVGQSFERVADETVPVIRATLDRVAPPAIEHHVTGYADIAGGIEQQTFDALKTAELIAGPLLFVILLLVFRSPIAAAVPLCLGFSSVASGRGLLAVLNAGTYPLDAAALSLATMFGLALGVDYSLLLVSRFREQLAQGDAPPDAARRAMAAAGRTILVAGLALAIGMVAGYFVAPNRLLSSGNIGGLVAVFASVAGAIVALPALLALLGDRVNRYQFGAGWTRGGGLAGLAWRAVSRPLLACVLVLVVLLGFCSQLIGLRVAPPSDGSLARSSGQLADLRAIGTQLGSGWIAPYEVIVRARDGLVTDPRVLAAMAGWQARLERDPSVAAAMGPQSIYGGKGPPSRRGSFARDAEINLELLRAAPPPERAAAAIALNLDRSGTALRMSVIGRSGFSPALSDVRAADPGDPLRGQLTAQAHVLEAKTGTDVFVGGPAADLQDFTSTSQDRLPLLVAVLSLATFLILLVAIRSLAVALIAVVLNILTVGAALGLLVLGFQHTGLLADAGPLDALVVPAVISIAFGLAIDYEVFLLARVREEMAIAGDADVGLRRALVKTAGIITGAAAIMCGVFIAFAMSSIVNLREYGVGLTIAVLIDATIVRLVLLPATIRLLGPRAWWIPAWLDRLIGRWHLERGAEVDGGGTRAGGPSPTGAAGALIEIGAPASEATRTSS